MKVEPNLCNNFASPYRPVAVLLQGLQSCGKPWNETRVSAAVLLELAKNDGLEVPVRFICGFETHPPPPADSHGKRRRPWRRTKGTVPLVVHGASMIGAQPPVDHTDRDPGMLFGPNEPAWDNTPSFRHQWRISDD